MRHLATIAAGICWATSASAFTVGPCNPGDVQASLNGVFLGIHPAEPSPGQPISIVAGVSGFVPIQAFDIQVHGSIVDVTVTAPSMGFLPPPPVCATADMPALEQGIYTVNLSVRDPNFPLFGPAFMMGSVLPVGSQISPVGGLSGLWWNAGEPGWGISFTQRRNIVFSAWYTYDSVGNPKWYVAPHCVLPTAAASGSCVEALYEVSGPSVFQPQFDPGAVHVAVAGSLRLNFANANEGSMTYDVAGQTRTVPITRQPISSGAVPPPIDYTDLWWNPNESGWGMSVTHQFDLMFLAWFVYDDLGRPFWYVSPNCRIGATFSNGCTGDVYRTTGPPLGPSFNPSRVTVMPAGTIEFIFWNADNAEVMYHATPGQTYSRNITRQVF